MDLSGTKNIGPKHSLTLQRSVIPTVRYNYLASGPTKLKADSDGHQVEH